MITTLVAISAINPVPVTITITTMIMLINQILDKPKNVMGEPPFMGPNQLARLLWKAVWAAVLA